MTGDEFLNSVIDSDAVIRTHRWQSDAPEQNVQTTSETVTAPHPMKSRLRRRGFLAMLLPFAATRAASGKSDVPAITGGFWVRDGQDRLGAERIIAGLSRSTREGWTDASKLREYGLERVGPSLSIE